MRIDWILLISLLSLSVGSCGSSQPAEKDLAPLEPQAPPGQELASPTPENLLQLDSTPESAEMPLNPPPIEKFISLSKKDLADRLQVDADRIALVRTAEIVWPNAALGCPAPGKVYAQGRVPGFQIWLEVEETEYIYNTDYNGQVILCPEQGPDNPDSLPPTTSSPTPHIGVPID